MLRLCGETWRYRGQEIGGEPLAFLREFIAAHPTSSRWKLSRQLCEALGWKQANGALRDVVCRGDNVYQRVTQLTQGIETRG